MKIVIELAARCKLNLIHFRAVIRNGIRNVKFPRINATSFVRRGSSLRVVARIRCIDGRNETVGIGERICMTKSVCEYARSVQKCVPDRTLQSNESKHSMGIFGSGIGK